MNKFLVIFIFFISSNLAKAQILQDAHGAVVRSDTSKAKVYLCFTGHDFDEGFGHVMGVLRAQNIRASFFLTGDFIRSHAVLMRSLIEDGHYIGAHSDKHLLYCDWEKRDSLLHSTEEIRIDISDNLKALKEFGLKPKYFMPPYEWYNKKVVEIAAEMGQTVVNFTPGTRSNADYTSPEMKNYMSSDVIMKSIYKYLSSKNMNGFHLLIHPGTSTKRKDKFYLHLEKLIDYLQENNYQFERF